MMKVNTKSVKPISKVMKVNTKSSKPISIESGTVEEVQDFIYPGSNISKMVELTKMWNYTPIELIMPSESCGQ